MVTTVQAVGNNLRTKKKNRGEYETGNAGGSSSPR